MATTTAAFFAVATAHILAEDERADGAYDAMDAG